jgi:metallophosphoesterase superfamily enzyme
MPIHLPPLTRRRFLQGTLAAGVGLGGARFVQADDVATDPHRFALLSDTHIAADRKQIAAGVELAGHLQSVVERMLSLDTRPSRAFIDGDCALGSGLPGDYATLIQLLEPLRRASLPIHMALGNHDDRANFRAAMLPADDAPTLNDHQVAVIETPRANWFLLDSLTYEPGRPGAFGSAQLAWLAQELDARPNKPALVLGHHDPNFAPIDPRNADAWKKRPGLVDTTALFEILVPRKQVKAYVYGHTHAWKLSEHEGIHLLNLPAVAYPAFQSAWIDLQLREDGATFERIAVNAKSDWGKHHRYDLKWRS